MSFGIPTSPGEAVRIAATGKVTESLNRAVAALDAGDNIGAAQGFFQATAVAAAYAAGTQSTQVKPKRR